MAVSAPKKILRMPPRLLVVALVLQLWIASVVAKCPPVCIHGKCTDGETCTCKPGFDGSDCALPVQHCDDSKRSCYNGAECVRNNEKDPVTKKYRYHCDCGKAYGVSSFAGLQCEHSHTQSCVKGKVSEYAFCTNSGECIKTIADGKQHAGCICPREFTGSHCQYRDGEVPPDELKEELGTFDGGGEISDGAIAFIVSVSFFATASFAAYVCYLQKKKNQQAASEHEFQVEEQVSPVEHSPTGNFEIGDSDVSPPPESPGADVTDEDKNEVNEVI